MENNVNNNCLTVDLKREPFGLFFELTLEDGQSEELEPEDVRTWFKLRGADMDKLEKILDHVWNFGSATVTVKNPRRPPKSQDPWAPKVGLV